VSLVELVRKDLFLFSAAVTLANERFEILKRFVSWAMLWCCSHDKPPPPTSKSDLPRAIAYAYIPLSQPGSLVTHLPKVQEKDPKALQHVQH
jgi:hypothetical protein